MIRLFGTLPILIATLGCLSHSRSTAPDPDAPYPPGFVGYPEMRGDVYVRKGRKVTKILGCVDVSMPPSMPNLKPSVWEPYELIWFSPDGSVWGLEK